MAATTIAITIPILAINLARFDLGLEAGSRAIRHDVCDDGVAVRVGDADRRNHFNAHLYVAVRSFGAREGYRP